MSELRQRHIHCIPRLRVRDEEIHLRTKPTGIIEASRRDTQELFIRAEIAFTARDARTAVGAKAALVLATSETRREVIFQLAFGQAKS